MTHPPTKKYEPPSDDNNDSSDENDTDNEGKKEEEKKPSVGIIFLWIVFIFGLIWVVCYFRDAILFFMVSVSFTLLYCQMSLTLWDSVVWFLYLLYLFALTVSFHWLALYFSC